MKPIIDRLFLFSNTLQRNLLVSLVDRLEARMFTVEHEVDFADGAVAMFGDENLRDAVLRIAARAVYAAAARVIRADVIVRVFAVDEHDDVSYPVRYCRNLSKSDSRGIL